MMQLSFVLIASFFFVVIVKSKCRIVKISHLLLPRPIAVVSHRYINIYIAVAVAVTAAVVVVAATAHWLVPLYYARHVAVLRRLYSYPFASSTSIFTV